MHEAYLKLSPGEPQWHGRKHFFCAAAEAMRRGGWWEVGALGSDRAIKRRILREMLAHYVASWRRSGRSVDAATGARPPERLPAE